MNSISVVFVLAACIAASSAVPTRVGFAGKCPVVPFVENFETTKFIGKWFAVKETGKEIPCVKYELEEIKPNHFHALVTPANVTIEFDKNSADDFSDGLRVIFRNNPFMNGGELRIFSTDYGELNP